MRKYKIVCRLCDLYFEEEFGNLQFARKAQDERTHVCPTCKGLIRFIVKGFS